MQNSGDLAPKVTLDSLMARGVVSLHCAYLQLGSPLLGENGLTWSSGWDPLGKRGVWGAGPPSMREHTG